MLGYLKAMRQWALLARIALATFALGAAFLFQIPLETEVPGEPFLLFFLVVMAATLTFGKWVGFYGVALSTILSMLFFEPGNSLALHQASDLVRIELYAVLAGGSVLGIAYLGGLLLAADEAAQAFEQLEHTKSVLLRELAHRVANNFAVVASLIRAKASQVDDGQAKSVLNEAVEQVMVLARVHSRLNAGRGDVALDSKSFLQELCDDLKTLVAPSQAVTIDCVAVSRRLCVEQAIPLGLIVNELVTNAVKYAFPDGRRGTITVNLRQLADRLSLSVEDNGVGHNGHVRGTGMGQQLVQALVQQLGGELEIRTAGKGTSVRVIFPDTAGEAPATIDVRPAASVLH